MKKGPEDVAGPQYVRMYTHTRTRTHTHIQPKNKQRKSHSETSSGPLPTNLRTTFTECGWVN